MGPNQAKTWHGMAGPKRIISVSERGHLLNTCLLQVFPYTCADLVWASLTHVAVIGIPIRTELQGVSLTDDTSLVHNVYKQRTIGGCDEVQKKKECEDTFYCTPVMLNAAECKTIFHHTACKKSLSCWRRTFCRGALRALFCFFI